MDSLFFHNILRPGKANIQLETIKKLKKLADVLIYYRQASYSYKSFDISIILNDHKLLPKFHLYQ